MEASDIHFSPENLVKMIQMIESGAINRKVAKKVFESIFDEDVDPEVYVEENGLKTVNDEGALRKVIEEIVANNFLFVVVSFQWACFFSFFVH